MSIRSPKHKYRGEIVFDLPRKGIGSVVSHTSNSIEGLRSLLRRYAPGHVTILENKSTYPDFQWVLVDEYVYNERDTIVDELSRKRIEEGLSQQEVADKMGIEQTSVSRLEKGIHSPSLDMIERYADAIGYKITIKKNE